LDCCTYVTKLNINTGSLGKKKKTTTENKPENMQKVLQGWFVVWTEGNSPHGG
jgi:hypothetical protein